tara:strand:- start:179 stop:514 length:336 start_codon:yes stop_codon:yes gene_type:complete
VSTGGCLGASLRWLILDGTSSQLFPWPTLIVNIIGCALLGILSNKKTDEKSWLLWSTGFCGGLTTFSTFTLEIATLLENKQFSVTFFYLTTSLVAGAGIFKTFQTIWARQS